MEPLTFVTGGLAAIDRPSIAYRGWVPSPQHDPEDDAWIRRLSDGDRRAYIAQMFSAEPLDRIGIRDFWMQIATTAVTGEPQPSSTDDDWTFGHGD